MTKTTKTMSLGMVGLGVMGKNMALNLTDNGFNVYAFDVDVERKNAAVEEENQLRAGGTPRMIPVDSLAHLVESLPEPRVVVLSVPAGEIVDIVCQELLDAGFGEADIVVDTGNSQWEHSIERAKKYEGKCQFFTCAVSGGEQGARFGPALMASGESSVWDVIQPMFEGMSAKVAPATGKPVERTSVEQPLPAGEPCAAYIGPVGSGHYVKMVHNGIEYADMQLLAEAYQIMRTGMQMAPSEISEVFSSWNNGPLGCYLLEISADILGFNDPETGKPIVDVIMDKAGQKGTGVWTGLSSLHSGCPTPAITQAVYARALSGLKAERVVAANKLQGPSVQTLSADEKVQQLSALHDALLCSKIAVYAQGFHLMQVAAEENQWQLAFVDIAKIWRAGCIIRANILNDISKAFAAERAEASLPNLMMADAFAEVLNSKQQAWRNSVIFAMQTGVSSPALSAALNYYDAYRSDVLPANLIQAQRDFFGAHLFQRIDSTSASQKYHVEWHKESSERRVVAH